MSGFHIESQVLATIAASRNQFCFGKDVARSKSLDTAIVTCRSSDSRISSTERLAIYPTNNEIEEFFESVNRLCLEKDLLRGEFRKQPSVNIYNSRYGEDLTKVQQVRLQGTSILRSEKRAEVQDDILKQSRDSCELFDPLISNQQVISTASIGSVEPNLPEDPPSFHHLYPSEDSIGKNCSLDFDILTLDELSLERPSMPLHKEIKDCFSLDGMKRFPVSQSIPKMDYNHMNDECISCPETTMRNISSPSHLRSSDISIHSTYSSNRFFNNKKKLSYRRVYLGDYMEKLRRESFDDSEELNLETSTGSCSHSESGCDESISKESVLNFFVQQKILFDLQNRPTSNKHRRNVMMNSSDSFIAHRSSNMKIEGGNLYRVDGRLVMENDNKSLHKQHPKHVRDNYSVSSVIPQKSDLRLDTMKPREKCDVIETAHKAKVFSDSYVLGRAANKWRDRKLKPSNESLDDSTHSTQRTEMNFVVCMGCVRILETPIRSTIVCCPVCRVATPINRFSTND